METYGGRRTKAEQDAATVEIGYALVSAALAAAVLFGAVAGPALLFALPPLLSMALLWLGLTAAGVVFPLRLVTVLVRFRRRNRAVGPCPDARAEPGRPGLTGPDA